MTSKVAGSITSYNDSQDMGERLCRRDVAACYRLLHHYGLDDLTDGFVAARVPDAPNEVIIGGYGLFPQLARPAVLHRRTLTENPPIEKGDGVDVDALLFSHAVLESRPDFNAVIHAHPPHALAFSALDVDLLPISQWGHMFHGRLGAIPFDNDVSSVTIRRMISWHLRNGMEAILLRNHGVIIPGRTMADAFFRLHRLEQAFQVQIAAMQTGAPLYRPDVTEARFTGEQYWTDMSLVDNDGSREWAGLLEILGIED